LIGCSRKKERPSCPQVEQGDAADTKQRQSKMACEIFMGLQVISMWCACQIVLGLI